MGKKDLRNLHVFEELCHFEEDIEEIDKELADFDILSKQNQNAESVQAEKEFDTAKDDEERESTSSAIRKDTLKREWDKPKLKEKMWEKHIQKLRSERKKCFAPMYETTSNSNYQQTKQKKSKNKKFKQTEFNETPPPAPTPTQPTSYTETVSKAKFKASASSFPFANAFYPMMFPMQGMMPIFGQPPPPPAPFFYPFPFQMDYSIPPPNVQASTSASGTDSINQANNMPK